MLKMECHLIIVVVKAVLAQIEIRVDYFGLDYLMCSKDLQLR
jgi:hypothetical protein